MIHWLPGAALAAAFFALPAAANAAGVHVKLGAGINAPDGGRLIVFATKGAVPASKRVEPDFHDPRATFIASVDVPSLASGAVADVAFTTGGLPAAIASAAPGTYSFSTVLDVHHHYAYNGIEPGDLIGPTVTVKFNKSTDVALMLDAVEPHTPLTPVEGLSYFAFRSDALSAFAGHDVVMNAVVIDPDPAATPKTKERYPTAYIIDGFGATQGSGIIRATRLIAAMNGKVIPKMFYVVLDPSAPTGHHVFADSANNGPWGTALTTEFIPMLEARYPTMMATVHGRFLTGHSSGGWSTLWLQISYPDVFGGTWSTSPDPVDFHNFTGPNLFDPAQNMYHRADGTPYNLVRDGGEDIETLRDYVGSEQALGATGGQFSSFNAVFSPRGADGKPLPLFDVTTGTIDRSVAAAWENYDIATVLRNRWSELGPKLAGKLHITVGTADTFHLNEGVELLAAELRDLKSDAQITFVPGKTHFDLYGPSGAENLQVQFFNAMLAASKK